MKKKKLGKTSFQKDEKVNLDWVKEDLGIHRAKPKYSELKKACT